MHINFVGTRALLIDLDGLNQVMDWHAALSAKPLKNQVDCIAAATTPVSYTHLTLPAIYSV